MASPCVIQYCKNIGTHRFPKDEMRKAKWLRAIKHNMKPALTIRKNSYICSAHFTIADFITTPTGFTKDRPRNVLKKNAIPSIFSCSLTPHQIKRASLEQPSSPLQMFDPSKVQATYSRIPPIAFVEMLPVGAKNMQTEETEDPLQQLNQGTHMYLLPQPFYQETESQETERDVVEDPQSSLSSLYLKKDIIKIEIGTKSVPTFL